MQLSLIFSSVILYLNWFYERKICRKRTETRRRHENLEAWIDSHFQGPGCAFSEDFLMFFSCLSPENCKEDEPACLARLSSLPTREYLNIYRKSEEIKQPPPQPRQMLSIFLLVSSHARVCVPFLRGVLAHTGYLFCRCPPWTREWLCMVQV